MTSIVSGFQHKNEAAAAAKSRPGRWRARAETYGTHPPNQPEGLELQFKLWWLSTILIVLSVRAMQIDTDDLVSASTLTRNTAFYVREAAAGRRIIILNNSIPTAALVSFSDLKRLVGERATASGAKAEDFLEALGIADLPKYDPRAGWATTDDHTCPLSAPIGVTDTGIYEVNITTVQHVFLTGVTGSGKSSALTTLLLALCARYSPQRLNIMMATPDFTTDPATAEPRAARALPHVASIGLREPLEYAEWTTEYTGRVATAVRDEIRRRRDLPARDAEPDMIVVFEEYPHGDEELRAVINELFAAGPELRMHLILVAQQLDLDTFTRTEIDQRMNCRIALGDSAARGAAQLPTTSPLAQGEATVQEDAGWPECRVRLFEPDMKLIYGDQTWTFLLTDRIRAAAAESSDD